MFKRKFARTIPDNLRAPYIKMWGFEAKRARKFTRTSPRTLPFFFHYHAFFFPDRTGSRLRGRTAIQRSKKGSEKVLERVLGEGSQKGSEKGACCGFYSKKGFWEGFSEGVLRREFPEGAQNAPLKSTPPQACALSTATLHFPEYPGPFRFWFWGSPSPVFWREMKLICWAALIHVRYIK